MTKRTQLNMQRPSSDKAGKNQRRFRLPLSVIFIGGLFVAVFILSLIGLSQQSQLPQIEQTGNRLPGYDFDVAVIRNIHHGDPVRPLFNCFSNTTEVRLDPSIGPYGVSLRGVEGWHKDDFVIVVEVCGRLQAIGEVRNIDLQSFTIEGLMYLELQPANFVPPTPVFTMTPRPTETPTITPTATSTP